MELFRTKWLIVVQYPKCKCIRSLNSYSIPLVFPEMCFTRILCIHNECTMIVIGTFHKEKSYKNTSI